MPGITHRFSLCDREVTVSEKTPYEPYPESPDANAGFGGGYVSMNAQPYPAPYGQGPVPVRMPGAVRAAQIVAWLAGAIGVAAVVAIAAITGDPERIGAAFAGFGIQIGLAGCAFAFATGGNGLRVAVITLACLQAMCGFGSVSAMQPPGLLGAVVGMAIFFLMIGQPARLWFGRPRP